MHIIRNLYCAVVAILPVVLLSSALATPMVDKDNKGPLKWPKGTTIKVFVPADPDGLGRDSDLIEGIKAWNDQQPLKDRNITIETMAGTAPANTQNAVQVKWTSETLKDPNDENQEVFGLAGPTYEAGTMNTIKSGEITISRDMDQVTSQMAKNLGIHEMGHVLGLDDITTGSASDTAMFNRFTKNDTVSITESDTKELSATYGANQQDTQVDVTPQVVPVPEGNQFIYDLEWLAGDPLGLFQVDINGADILSVVLPIGWEVADGLRANDVVPNPIPVLEPQDFITFRIADGIHYLSEEFPSLTFGFTASGDVTTVEAMLNGRFMTTGPIPQPATLALLGLGLVALGLGRRRRRR